MSVKSTKKITGQIIKYIHNTESTMPSLSYGTTESAMDCVNAVVNNGEIYYAAGVYYNSQIDDTYLWKCPRVNLSGSVADKIVDCNYKFVNGAIVSYNGKIHLLGSSDSSAKKYHRIVDVDNKTITSATALPQNYSYAQAVVLDNKIHLFGGETYPKRHYTWDGSTWTLESTETPIDVDSITKVIADNDGYLHIFRYLVHYKLVNGNWVQQTDMPYSSNDVNTTIFKDSKIYIFSEYNYYVIDGSNSTQYDSPFRFHKSASLLLNGNIVLLGGYYTPQMVYYLL